MLGLRGPGPCRSSKAIAISGKLRWSLSRQGDLPVGWLDKWNDFWEVTRDPPKPNRTRIYESPPISDHSSPSDDGFDCPHGSDPGVCSYCTDDQCCVAELASAALRGDFLERGALRLGGHQPGGFCYQQEKQHWSGRPSDDRSTIQHRSKHGLSELSVHELDPGCRSPVDARVQPLRAPMASSDEIRPCESDLPDHLPVVWSWRRAPFRHWADQPRPGPPPGIPT